MTEYNDKRTPNSDDQTSNGQTVTDPTIKVTVNNAADNNPATLWLIDDDAALRLVLADTFEDAGLDVISFTQAQAAWTRLNDILQGSAEPLPDVILTDIRMPMMDGLSFSDWVHKHFPKLPIVIMTAHSDLTSAINSYQTGAFEYLPKPFDLDDAVATIYKAINHQPNMPVKSNTTEPDSTPTTDKPADNDATFSTNTKPVRKVSSANKTNKVNDDKAAVKTDTKAQSNPLSTMIILSTHR